MDMISELPDDILLYMLSSLSVKEVGRASVVSKRWRHLWKYNPNLIFDKYLSNKYFDWVDKVVNSHEAETIEEFKVCVDIKLVDESNNNIDNWFRFAMEKRVKRLQIDLTPFYRRWNKRRHMFPPTLSLCNTLTSLKLGFIDIDGEILERILPNCQALEHLSVKYSISLLHLNVSALNLKVLKLRFCYNMRQLEISASNLESFSYCGLSINVQFKSTLKLVEVYVGGHYGKSLTNICSEFSSYLSQIQVLRIDCGGYLRYSLYKEEPALLQSLRLGESILFERLVKLEMYSNTNVNQDLEYLTWVIKACPHLQHFKLWFDTSRLRELPGIKAPVIKREEKKWEARPHYHLEILEIVGFIGCPVDLELVAYIIESARSLNKIIANTRQIYGMHYPTRYFEEIQKTRLGEIRLARKQAEVLRERLKPAIVLEII